MGFKTCKELKLIPIAFKMGGEQTFRAGGLSAELEAVNVLI